MIKIFLFWLYNYGIFHRYIDGRYNMPFELERRKLEKMDKKSYAQFRKNQVEGLKKNKKRNIALLRKLNHIDTLEWLIKYMKRDGKKGHSRKDEGDLLFNAHFSLAFCYSTINMLLAKDFDTDFENKAKRLLDAVCDARIIIENN